MVKNVTSLTGSGLRDWLFQRLSAIIVAAYVIFLFGYVLFSPSLTFAVWHELFSHTIMRIITLVVLMAVMVHAYVGMWTISTDYLKNTGVRLLFPAAISIALIAFFIWGVIILWGL